MYLHVNVYITATIHQMYSSMKKFKYFWQLIKSLIISFAMTTPVKNYSFFVYVQIAPFSFLHYLFSKIFQEFYPLIDIRTYENPLSTQLSRITGKQRRSTVQNPFQHTIKSISSVMIGTEPSVNVLRYHFSKGNIPSIVLSLKSLERTTKS